MKGAELKEKLKSSRYTMAEIAKMMGVSPQNLNNTFSVEDVKSGFLERLSEVLEVPITYFYGDSYTITGNNNATGNNNTVNASDDRLLLLLLNKDEQLTMAMKQTSKAQEQMDIVLQGMRDKHII